MPSMATTATTVHASVAANRSRAVRRVLWLTLFGNLGVALAKLIVGTGTHTLSMIADGYHSILDSASNVVGLMALSFAHRPPDADHHYGHRKFEVLASIGIAVMLLVAATEILAHSWKRFQGGGDLAVFSFVSVSVMLLSMIVNITVSRYESRKGAELHSPFLLADSRHTASDVYASASVLVALIALRSGQAWIDPLAALLIGGVILHAGYKILRWSLGVLADRAFIDSKTIEEIALRFPHVHATRQVRTRGFSDAVFVDLVVLLDASLTLKEAHEICDDLEDRITKAFPEIADIVVHAEPFAGDTDPSAGH
ncbi:MAG: cation diffusion facilitator family transporter [Acidobacteriota bacterium]